MIGAESSNGRGRIIQTPRGRIIQIGAEFVGAEFVRGRIVQLPFKRFIQIPRGRISQIGAEFVGAEFVRGRIVQLPFHRGARNQGVFSEIGQTANNAVTFRKKTHSSEMSAFFDAPKLNPGLNT